MKIFWKCVLLWYFLIILAFVLAKSTKKAWQYSIAILLAVLFYAAVIKDLNHIESK